MSQPRIDVFKHEYWLNLAVSSLLLSKGMNQPVKQGDGTVIHTPSVGIKSVFNGWWGQDPKAPHLWVNRSTQEKFPDTTDGSLFLKVQTRRSDPLQDHDSTVGTVRGLLLTGRTSINGKMPWHTLARLQETGTVPDHQQDQDFNLTTLSFAVRLQILFDTKKEDIFPA